MRLVRHARPAELIDLAEGGGTQDVAQHVEQCSECRKRLRGLRTMIALNEMARDADGGDVPETSPLFWTHFPGRVRTALKSAVHRERIWWPDPLTAPRAVLALSAALLVGLVAGFVVSRMPVSGWTDRQGTIVMGEAAGGATVVDQQVAGEGAFPTFPELAGSVNEDEGDPGWALVLHMAESARWDDATPIDVFVSDGAADRALYELSVAERRELKRLLEVEIGATGSGPS